MKEKQPEVPEVGHEEVFKPVPGKSKWKMSKSMKIGALVLAGLVVPTYIALPLVAAWGVGMFAKKKIKNEEEIMNKMGWGQPSGDKVPAFSAQEEQSEFKVGSHLSGKEGVKPMSFGERVGKKMIEMSEVAHERNKTIKP